MSWAQPFSILEIKALLMAQEEMIERFKKTYVNMVQAHLAQSSLQVSKNSQDSRSTNQGNGQDRGNGGRKGWGRSFKEAGMASTMVAGLSANSMAKLAT